MPTATATIANGASLSGAVDLQATNPQAQTQYDPTVVAIITPVGWDTNDMTFQVSADGTTYVDLYRVGVDGAVSEYKITAAVASTCYQFPSPGDWCAYRYLKVRSGTSGSPVNQAGAVALTIIARDFS